MGYPWQGSFAKRVILRLWRLDISLVTIEQIFELEALGLVNLEFLDTNFPDDHFKQTVESMVMSSNRARNEAAFSSSLDSNLPIVGNFSLFSPLFLS